MIYLSTALALVGLAVVLAARNVALRWLAVVHGHKRAADIIEVSVELADHRNAVAEDLHALRQRLEALEADDTSADALRRVKELSAKAAFGGPRR